MNHDRRENLIQRYLLGDLAEAEQSAFEQELLGDQDKFHQVWSIEYELVDSYVRGELSGAERARFEENYLASSLHQKRVRLARLLLQNIDRNTGERWPRDSFLNSLLTVPPAALAALVMAFLLLTGSVGLMIDRTRLEREIARIRDDAQRERSIQQLREDELRSQNRSLETEIAEGRRRSEQLKSELERLGERSGSDPEGVISYQLKPSGMRNEEAPEPLTIPLFKGRVNFRMQLEGKEHPSYQIKLQTVEGREIRLTNKDKSVSVIGDSLAGVTIPAGKLAPGEYVIILYGQRAGRGSDEIERFVFRTK